MEAIKEQETTKKLLWDIIVDVSWANISKRYFGKSRSWLHHKLDGTDSKGGFTEEERETLKEALNDLSHRIKMCAEKL